MTVTRIIFGILKAIVAMGMSVMGLVEIRALLEAHWGVMLSPGVFQIALTMTILLAIKLGAGGFIDELKAAHKKKKSMGSDTID